MEPSSGRRVTDNISAAVRLAIEEATAATRHTLRQESVVIAARLETLTLQNAQEHTEVKGHVMELIEDMADVKKLIPRVADLEKNDAVLAAIHKQRNTIRNAAIGLAGVIVASAGVVVAAVPH